MRLTLAGHELEPCEPAAPPFSGVVVGAVLDVQRHPNADKLSVCRVDDGRGHELGIVCGAPNVHAGMRAPLALDGATLPGGVKIRRSKLRGVSSGRHAAARRGSSVSATTPAASSSCLTMPRSGATCATTSASTTASSISRSRRTAATASASPVSRARSSALYATPLRAAGGCAVVAPAHDDDLPDQARSAHCMSGLCGPDRA